MPSIQCLCGARVDLGRIPAERGLQMFRQDRLWPAMTALAAELADSQTRTRGEVERIMLRSLGMSSPIGHHGVQCGQCLRLLILDREDDIVAAFQPDPQRPPLDFFS